jgi:general secretion pathway protein K
MIGANVARTERARRAAPGARTRPLGGRRAERAPKGSQTGIALVLTLWLTVLLTAIAGGFAYSMHTEAVAAGNAIAVAKVRATADGAVERAVYELARPRVPGAWLPNGAPRAWKDGEIDVVVRATDETAKIDLNAANEMLLRGLFTVVGGADPDTAARLVDALMDWRDADDLRRANGAEAADYAAAGAKTPPANGPLETIGEVARVLGMTPSIYARIAGSVTVYSRQGGINPLTASREVLLALPNADAAVVDAYLAQREDALANGLPLPPFPGAAGFTAGAVQTWRIRAEARTPDGVTFVREAVARPSPDPARPLVVLAWLVGAATPAAPTDGRAENNDAARP